MIPFVQYEFEEIKAAINFDKNVAANVGYKSLFTTARQQEASQDYRRSRIFLSMVGQRSRVSISEQGL